MTPSRSGTIAALVGLAVLGYVALRPVGALPALGSFFDPSRGIWSAAAVIEHPVSASASIPGLGAETRVVYDDRQVPHIFAKTRSDAYRALGYVVARDRLFQLDVQSRAGGGTLTELAGAQALPVDRETHASGLPHSARNRVAAYDTTSEGWQFVRAYADGVNAYVDGLSERDLPFEYKLLGRKPERWEPIDLFHLLNRMGVTLASSSDELVHLDASARVGRVAADALFPMHAPIVEPIQPNGAAEARVDVTTLPPPGAPDSAAVIVEQALGKGLRSLFAAANASRSDDAIGSNNWAVAPSRSASGKALLAGDPHLELTLPSIWFEVHLVVPGELDVYGVTIPGAPGVVIGFNRALAWTFTNTGADVMDYYVEQVDDSIAPTRYMLDGAWKPLKLETQRYRGPGGEVIATDTLRFTHRGPMQRISSRWISVRWTVLEALRDFEAFERASRTTSARELLDAMAEVYGAPAQNMLVADTAGTIAIRSTGRYPLRPGNGRGDWLQDGTSSRNDWTGNWPIADYPQSFNPPQGYIASANQEPIDPKVQPRYLGSNWERPWRAMRINALLRADSAVTPDAMRQYQVDPGSARADWFVPAFLNAVRNVQASDKLTRAASLLSEWDRRYTTNNTRAVLFEQAMTQLSRRLWDELRPDTSSRGPIPNDMITAVLLKDSTSVWWDDKRTPTVENRDALLASALENALDDVTKNLGEPNSPKWRWDEFRFANIHHLLGLPALSRTRIPVQGGSATLWPSTGNGRHGPSWRMVVELDKRPRAWATYPGGQSGNPLSPYYDNRITGWSAGRLDTLRVPASADELAGDLARATLTLVPVAGRATR